MTFVRLAFFFCVVTLLSACGGGGGSGGGSSSGPSFSLSSSQITFAAIQNGSAPTSQVVIATASGGTVYFDQTFSGSALSGVSRSCPGGNTCSFTLTPSNPVGLAPGTYTSTVTIYGSTNPFGGSQIPGSPQTVNVTYNVGADIAAAPGALNFMFATGGLNPAAQNVNVVVSGGVNWTASSNQSWLGISSTSGAGPGTLSVSVNPSGLAVGHYRGALTLAAPSSGDTTVVDVSFDVVLPAISVNPSSLTLSAIAGVAIPAQSFNVTMNNGTVVNWNAASGASWLVLNKISGTTPDTMIVDINPAGLSAGIYTSTITFTGAGLSAPTTVNVTFNYMLPTFSFTPGSLSFGGTTGHEVGPQTVQISLNTGANAYTWSASSANAWLQASPASGSVSAAPATTTVTVNAAGISAGTQSGSLTFTTVVNGNTVTGTLPVNLSLDAHKILANDTGVAFTSTPSLSKLTRTLMVTSNRGATINWGASADQTWLTVTPSGTTGGNLVLTANPSGLVANAVYYANVSVTSSDVSVTNTETVRVGLWVGSTTPAATTTVNAAYYRLITDPIRPYAYVHSFGTDITVYNIYTGAVVATIPNVATQLDGMAISDDGTMLYVADFTNWRIVPVNLDTYALGSAWPLRTFGFYNGRLYLAYARTNGYGSVISSDDYIYDASTGTRKGEFFAGQIVSASRDGSRFCGLVSTSSPYEVKCFSLGNTSNNGGQLLIGPVKTGEWINGGSGWDAALNPDGTRAYVTGHGTIFDAATTTATMPTLGTLNCGPGPVSIEFAADDRIYCASVFTDNLSQDIFVLNSAGVLQTSYASGGGLRRLRLSGDQLRMIGVVDGSYLKFITNQ